MDIAHIVFIGFDNHVNIEALTTLSCHDYFSSTEKGYGTSHSPFEVYSCSAFHFHEDGLIFRFHELRHTFATRALEQGMDVVAVSRLLGHATPSVTLDKYGHALNDHKWASVEKLGGVYSASRGIPRPRER